MGKLTGYFYNHINKKGYFYNHENIASYATWNTTISKIVHPSLSKDIKGLMQIKRSKCYWLMLLYLKINCINKRYNARLCFPDTRRSDDKLFWEFFVNISAVIRAMLRLLTQLKVNFYSSNFKKNKYEMGVFWYCYFRV